MIKSVSSVCLCVACVHCVGSHGHGELGTRRWNSAHAERGLENDLFSRDSGKWSLQE